MGTEDALARLVATASTLIENAGDGDWNRESAEWQLAAAQWKRDLAAVGVAPEPFVLEPDIGVEAAVMRTIGAASTCWTEIRNAGVFDSARAEQIGVAFLGWLSDRARTDACPDPGEARVEISPEHGVRAFNQAGEQVSPPPRWLEAGVAPSGRDYRDDPIQTAGHAWQADLDQERAAQAEPGRAEAQEPPETRTGLDLGDDPDGDIEGYDGPLGRPGGYCHGSEPWHPHGTVTGCCAFGGPQVAPEHQTP